MDDVNYPFESLAAGGRILRHHGPDTTEELATIGDLDRLFDTCVSRWGSNWNLEKLCVAIEESEID